MGCRGFWGRDVYPYRVVFTAPYIVGGGGGGYVWDVGGFGGGMFIHTEWCSLPPT